MKKFLIWLLLLVITNLDLTHANNIGFFRNNMKSTNLFLFKVRNSKIVKRKVSGQNSVVQNWNLICNELCGAGLEGPECRPYCKKSNQKGLHVIMKASQILGESRQILCSILCNSNLGDPICMCPTLIDGLNQSSIVLEHNIICNSFCDYNSFTLNGCSPCLNNNLKILSNENGQKAGTNYLMNFSTTTTTQIITTNTTTASKQQTTPNWNRVCIDLCKKGDGGALCNCDLPPFF